MKVRSDVYAYFWVQKYDCSSEEISSMMQISPTEVRERGDVSQNGKVRNHSLWQLDSPLARGDNFLQDYLSQLLDILEIRESAIKTLVQKYEAGINCVGYYYGSNPGLHLSAELIKRVAQLDLSVDFDLYNYAGDEDVE